MLTRCAHLENKGQGVRVFSLSPGTVATDMQRKIKASGINPVSQMDFAQHAPVEAPARALVWLLHRGRGGVRRAGDLAARPGDPGPHRPRLKLIRRIDGSRVERHRARGAGDRRRSGRADGGRGAGGGGPARAGRRGDALDRAQAADGRQVGAEPDEGRGSGAPSARPMARAADWLAPMLGGVRAGEAQDWARGLGVEVFTGSSGRVFPVGMKASPLLRAWAGRLARAGVTLRTRWRWRGWRADAAVFDTPDGPVELRPARDGAGARRRVVGAARVGRGVAGDSRGRGRGDRAVPAVQRRLSSSTGRRRWPGISARRSSRCG